MNRIAGYSCYEKTPPDYDKALAYMETLFKTVAPTGSYGRIIFIWPELLVKRNQNYPKMADDLTSLQTQLDKEKGKLAIAANCC